MDPGEAARATRRYFRQLPIMVHSVCADWASKTDRVLRRTPNLPKLAARAIKGRAIRTGGQSFAQITCDAPLGLWIERGTGIYGPFKRMIVPKGGSYVDPTNPNFRTRHFLRWKGTVWSAARGGVSGSQGWIFARAVRGSKARPWFVPGVEARIPAFRRCIMANMARAASDITLGGVAARGIIQSG